MSERLKQIWAGFADQTTRNLTGNGINNIHVPNRREWRADDAQFLPQDFEQPAERAFAALDYAMANAAKKHAKNMRNTSAPQDSTHSAYGDHNTQARFAAAMDPRRALLASLRETDFRVLRREIDYTQFAATETEDRLKNKPKKKRFGLF